MEVMDIPLQRNVYCKDTNTVGPENDCTFLTDNYSFLMSNAFRYARQLYSNMLDLNLGYTKNLDTTGSWS